VPLRLRASLRFHVDSSSHFECQAHGLFRGTMACFCLSFPRVLSMLRVVPFRAFLRLRASLPSRLRASLRLLAVSSVPAAQCGFELSLRLSAVGVCVPLLLVYTHSTKYINILVSILAQAQLCSETETSIRSSLVHAAVASNARAMPQCSRFGGRCGHRPPQRFDPGTSVGFLFLVF
jgi:hypothetical protein